MIHTTIASGNSHELSAFPQTRCRNFEEADRGVHPLAVKYRVHRFGADTHTTANIRAMHTLPITRELRQNELLDGRFEVAFVAKPVRLVLRLHHVTAAGQSYSDAAKW
jgi:hypothetical protein